MRVIGIDHVQLAMPRGGENRARDFYVGILGLTETPKPPLLAARGGCWFVDGAVQLHLGVEDDFRPALKAHPALLIDDIGELLVRLRNAGHEVREGDEIDGRPQRFIDDPFGNRIELIG